MNLYYFATHEGYDYKSLLSFMRKNKMVEYKDDGYALGPAALPGMSIEINEKERDGKIIKYKNIMLDDAAKNILKSIYREEKKVEVDNPNDYVKNEETVDDETELPAADISGIPTLDELTQNTGKTFLNFQYIAKSYDFKQYFLYNRLKELNAIVKSKDGYILGDNKVDGLYGVIKYNPNDDEEFYLMVVCDSEKVENVVSFATEGIDPNIYLKPEKKLSKFVELKNEYENRINDLENRVGVLEKYLRATIEEVNKLKKNA